MFGDDSVCNWEVKCCRFLPYTEEPCSSVKTRAALIEKLAASGGGGGGFASWFQSGVPAERRRRQLPIGSASLLRGDGWACHAPSPCRCNWGFGCCGTTRFVFPGGAGGGKQRVASCTRWKRKVLAGSLIIHTDSEVMLIIFRSGAFCCYLTLWGAADSIIPSLNWNKKSTNETSHWLRNWTSKRKKP